MFDALVSTVARDPRILELTRPQLEGYAAARGWVRYPHPYTPFWQNPEFILNDGRPILLVIPTDNRKIDFAQRAVEMIRQLSDLEDRPQSAILDDISPPVNAGKSNGTRRLRANGRTKSKPEAPAAGD